LAPALLGGVEAERPRAGLRQALAEHGEGYEGEDRTTYDRLARRADDVLVSAVGDAFRVAFAIAGGLALLGAAVLAGGGARAGYPSRPRPPGPRERAGDPSRTRPPGRPDRAGRTALAAAALVLAVAVPLAYAALHARDAPAQVAIEDPCADRELPGTGGIAGFLQDRALEGLDAAACRFGSSREELVLALANDAAARRFERRHGVDPRSVSSVLGHLIHP
ncbi:MAG TPA: hypothetical protein VF250_03380, partial [Conexibacter sp.]